MIIVPFFFRFVEIMAPVFSREAWRCVWHMIQVCYDFQSTRNDSNFLIA